jgi:ubiquinone/menaquinone biosynthesis C-methylase UbiE
MSARSSNDRTLTPQQVGRFYDRFGRLQDTQAFYEDAAVAVLVRHADFGHASAVFELGCGTGRFASQLLAQHLPATATYLGTDVSRTMIELATRRVSPHAERARVALSDGAMSFPLPGRSVDRVVCIYVLDILSPTAVGRMLDEAHRVLEPDGRLCLASLTRGVTVPSRVLTTIWATLFGISPSLVGGCRPIRLTPYLDARSWTVEFDEVATRFAVPTEVLIARPRVPRRSGR